MHLSVACIQMNSGADMAENIGFLQKLVGEAAAKGAQFIATPENSFLMEEGGQRVLYTQENHPGVLAAAELAKKHGVWLLIGSVAISSPNRGEAGRGARVTQSSQTSPHPNPPPIGEGTKAYNRSILFNPQGEITAAYDKIHLFDVDIPGDRSYRESDKMLGGAKLVTAALPQATLGLTICYDVRFPQLYRALAKAGAQLLAVPAAFTKITGEAHWHTLLRARAIENGCFVIAPAQTGNHPAGRQTYGHSLIIDPWGKVLADGGEEAGVVMADIDLGEVAKVRARLPSLEHDRAFS